MHLNHELSQVIKHWRYIAPIISHPKNHKEYEKLLITLDQLLTIVGKDEKHPLIDLVDLISHFIEEYEEKIYKIEQKLPTGLEALKFLMLSNNLSQSDLNEIGSQGVVSEILNGKRQLNLRQIKLLAKRFNVNPATFIDNE